MKSVISQELALKLGLQIEKSEERAFRMAPLPWDHNSASDSHRRAPPEIYPVPDLPLGNNESPYHDPPLHNALQVPGCFPEVPQLMPQPPQHFTLADNFGPSPGTNIHGGGHKTQENPADSQDIIMQDLMSDIEFAPPEITIDFAPPESKIEFAPPEITIDDAPRSRGEFLAVPQTDAKSPPDRPRCKCSMKPL